MKLSMMIKLGFDIQIYCRLQGMSLMQYHLYHIILPISPDLLGDS